MKRLTSVDDIAGLGTILGVWAHPDDETFSSAGIMATAAQNGQKVICITATKGEKGVQDESRWPADKLGDIRAHELAQALKIIHVQHHHWLGYPDGACKDVNENEAIIKIQEFIDLYNPDSILTFGPEGMTGHDDHCTVSRWVSKAVEGLDVALYHTVQLYEIYEEMREADSKFNFFFNIDEPPLVEAKDCAILLRLSEDLIDKKFRCLSSMPSQYDGMLKHFSRESVCKMICTEAFIQAK